MVENPAVPVGVELTPDELRTRAQKLFGRKWKIPLAKELGVHLATIYMWIPDKHGNPAPRKIPRSVDVWFELQESKKKIERFARGFLK